MFFVVVVVPTNVVFVVTKHNECLWCVDYNKVSIQQYDLGAKGQCCIYLNPSTAHYDNISFIFFIECYHTLHTDYPQFQITAITL